MGSKAEDDLRSNYGQHRRTQAKSIIDSRRSKKEADRAREEADRKKRRLDQMLSRQLIGRALIATRAFRQLQRLTLNAQRSTLNNLSWALGVGRWALGVVIL